MTQCNTPHILIRITLEENRLVHAAYSYSFVIGEINGRAVFTALLLNNRAFFVITFYCIFKLPKITTVDAINNGYIQLI